MHRKNKNIDALRYNACLLYTSGLDNLINIKIKFDNEEIFYNMIKK